MLQWQHELRLFSEAQEINLQQSGPFLKMVPCHSNQVNFRALPINSIANFLLYLFQERMLQPSILNGQRSAIADKLVNLPTNARKDENLTCLLT